MKPLSMTEVRNVQKPENSMYLEPYSSSFDTDTGLPVKSKIRNKKHKVARKNWFAAKNRNLREIGSKYYGRVEKDSKWVYFEREQKKN